MPKFTPALPSSIGKYRVEKVLGTGGMGAVYLAVDPVIQRQVAIKCIHPQMMSGELGKEIRSRFHREIQTIGQLDHDNIVRIYDALEFEGLPCYVMEFVHGQNLKSYLASHGKVNTDDAISIIQQLLEGLSHIHQHKIVHRDIKPENIFITPKLKVKLADFGIARVQNTELTLTGSSLGTPSYMSPEQWLGNADHRSDLYSVGVIFYEMLTGLKPFRSSNTDVLRENLFKGSHTPPSTVNKKLSPRLDKVIAKAIHKTPLQRYQQADQFFNALKKLRTKNQDIRQSSPSSPSSRWLKLSTIFFSFALGAFVSFSLIVLGWLPIQWLNINNENILFNPESLVSSPSDNNARYPLRIQISPDTQLTQPGQSINLSIELDQGAYLYCYLVDDTFKVQRFFPNRFEKHAWQPAFSAITLPGEQPFELSTSLSHQEETVYCFGMKDDVFELLPKRLRGGDFQYLNVRSIKDIREGFQKVSKEAILESTLKIKIK